MRLPRFFALTLACGMLCAALPAWPAAVGERVKVWVALRDKGPWISATPVRQFEDAPVYGPHLARLREAGVEIVTVLKWQNRISGWVDSGRLGMVAGLSCVRDVEEMPRKAVASPLPEPVSGPMSKMSASAQSFGAFDSLFIKTGLAALRDTVAARGLRAGEGVRIAVMDADFLLGHQAFDSLFARNAIVDQWDFVDGDAVSVSRTWGSSHGANVLSQICGDLPGVLQGAAPHARFLLYRTEEVAQERYVEEDYLAAALERAVDSGAQVISTSLNYRYDFTSQPTVAYSAMDGRTRPASLAALGAARRGVLMVNSIGNEGALRDSLPTLASPADADSILTVGIVNAARARCSYSSTGPSFDGRIKPELASFGCTVPVANPATTNGYYNLSGTSFAAPLVAGVAVLLRQLHPDSTGTDAQDIRRALMGTAVRAGEPDTASPDLFASPDNFTGYGLLRAAQAHCFLESGILCSGTGVPPVDPPVEPPIGVKGLYVWRGGSAVAFPWPNALNGGKIRAWDLQGRSVFLRGSLDAEGNFLLQAEGRRAPAPLILKIPPE
jgi:serine protease AprX